MSVFLGVIYPEISCAMLCLVSVVNASTGLFVKTQSFYYSVNLLNEYVIAKCLLGNNLPGTEF
jgi:hypothetical protein